MVVVRLECKLIRRRIYGGYTNCSHFLLSFLNLVNVEISLGENLQLCGFMAACVQE